MEQRHLPSIVTETLTGNTTELHHRINTTLHPSPSNGNAKTTVADQFSTSDVTKTSTNVDRTSTAVSMPDIPPKTVPFSTLNCVAQKLLKEAVSSRQHAYCPYSNFQVGAAVLCEDGSIFGGCNVENCSFTVGLCAERTAYVKAISQGQKKFKAVAVVALHEKFMVTPCGACRQFMSEFGDVVVYCSKPNLDDVFTTNLLTLIPHTFAL